MRVLIDTNIIMDVLANREGFSEPASQLFRLCEVGQVQGVIYALSIANIAYIMRKELDREQIKDVIAKLDAIFTIADMNGGDLKKAAELPIDDFEDALQSVCASRLKADFIVTRNLKDFKNSKVMAIKPSELIERMAE
ncbi:MAG: PIN domain-containing protein [Clostridia bacterium]|nr:PIN domain-containing protein [Clostridia bacterium]